ncbi:glycosyltransferase family 2 protein [Nitrosovibrio tenuis]|uniref:Glycosyltransferase involved in cell wall bisynthesis n=1 Tax=Nitrosovibrio tenuis TaxID=1233 RepID=A0A1H7FXW3_9PROT|nr:glycosyltransferase [Nitrosovibrio tenuis]SEK28255.1 Glycosyltransferase involved in cell wall bisynthesis [Nitrosovibrio tenuis]
MRSSQPTVSVIIPTYNCESYIVETLESILDQTFKNIEIIVVDDGSTDRTCQIVSSYGALVRLVTQSNSGVCAARNRGIREAAGRYLCLMDHDDYWFPDKLALQLEEMDAHPEVGLVYSTFIWWWPDADGTFPDPGSYRVQPYPAGIDEEFSGWIYHLLLLDCWVLTSSALIRAEVFDKCGVFDESLPYSEDWDLWLRISREYPFIKVKKPLTLYRQHPRQGNLIPRNTDYRTELLVRSATKWGLCSRDGRCISKREFRQTIARYHKDFGIRHLASGNLKIANRSFLKSWLKSPFGLKSLLYIPAGLFGWRPKW